MNDSLATHPTAPAPLEDFLREYAETVGGVWEAVEPQVYDVMIPSGTAPSRLDPAGHDILRVTFDPEALPEHPGSQLASFGTPLIDSWLADAVRRGRFSQFYFVGLNLTPHDLLGRARRALALAPELELRLERVRALHFGQAVFWFQATFVSDQKEQEILPVAVDMHYARLVRHLEKLVDRARLAERPALPLPDARRCGLPSAYSVARDEVIRRLGPLANGRQRELRERLNRQEARMRRYYADLRGELEGQAHRGKSGEDAQARAAARREAIGHEERLRVAELQQKNTLRVHLRVLTLLMVQQPKLLLRCGIGRPGRSADPIELVWDPLTEAFEAVPCPICQRPTFALGQNRLGHVACADCSQIAIKRPHE
jgi:hypothetical protein